MERDLRGKSTAGDQNKVLEYEQYVNRGRQVKASIDANHTKDKIVKRPGELPTDKATESADLEDGYIRVAYETGENFHDAERYRALLAQHAIVNIPGDTKFVRMEWNTRKQVDQPEEDGNPYPLLVNESYYNADEEIIITEYMHSNHDGWPKEAAEKNPASEITWQSWKMVAGKFFF
jgi:hypothetical protein